MPDRSTHATVVEYAVHQMFKGQSPKTAAKTTAKKLGGAENIFIGPGIVEIDPIALEAALWDRLVVFVTEGILKVKPGFEHYALDGAIAHFQQKPSIRAKLKKLVVTKLGGDPFPHDTK